MKRSRADALKIARSRFLALCCKTITVAALFQPASIPVDCARCIVDKVQLIMQATRIGSTVHGRMLTQAHVIRHVDGVSNKLGHI